MVTEEKRRIVIALLAFGKDETTVAASLGITPPTLRKHYFRELRCRGDARARLDAKLLATALAQVEAGNTSAMALLWKRLDRHDLSRAGMAVPKAPKLGKKEQQRRAATIVPQAWGDLVSKH